MLDFIKLENYSLFFNIFYFTFFLKPYSHSVPFSLPVFPLIAFPPASGLVSCHISEDGPTFLLHVDQLFSRRLVRSKLEHKKRKAGWLHISPQRFFPDSVINLLRDPMPMAGESIKKIMLSICSFSVSQ